MARVKIKVRVNEPVRFPGQCVHCAYPAADWMPIKRRIGRTTREITVPVCENCAQTLARRSQLEERWTQLGWLLAGLTAVLLPTLVILLLPGQLAAAIRAGLALLIGATGVAVVLQLARRARHHAALPPKKEIRRSASIVDFSWRATTFEFTNELFAKRFRELNESLLMSQS